ncbi:hypothetical protein BHE74_00049030 [Ensete ventricosum]|nr:hypothetical protein BHE74_00049030 [Ensete ventricosum]
MASSPPRDGRRLLALRLVLAAAILVAADAIGLDLHHRFSSRVREWAEARDVAGAWWPEKGTAEYYTSLAHQDRALRGRFLAAANYSQLAFAAEGNVTFQISSLGLYAFSRDAEAGVPGGAGHREPPPLGALRLPTVCSHVRSQRIRSKPSSEASSFTSGCTSHPRKLMLQVNMTFNIYSPSNSSTSRKLLCSDSMCETTCTGADSNCPYGVTYADNSSTSGVLVEDTLYLVAEDTSARVVEAPIVFGYSVDSSQTPSPCASEMTASAGWILETKAANSNRKRRSIAGSEVDGILLRPTLRAVSGSYVGCSSPSDLYVIGLTGMAVGNSAMAALFRAFVDSGTSFTYLSEPMYTSLAQTFDSQVREKRRPPNPNLPFDYCYDLRGCVFYVLLPCLAVENFMAGLRVVFDRERLVLGWENSDCE